MADCCAQNTRRAESSPKSCSKVASSKGAGSFFWILPPPDKYSDINDLNLRSLLANIYTILYVVYGLDLVYLVYTISKVVVDIGLSSS